MKRSGAMVLAAALAAALALQGCATAGGGQAASSSSSSTWEATGPNSAITTQASRNQPVVKADTKDNFEAVEAAIHKQMQPGGRWQYVSEGERATIDGNFADMQKLFDQYGSVDKMDQAARNRLIADQNSINTILTKKDGDRIICQMQTPVGSHLPQKVCTTYAQVQAQQHHAQQQMQQAIDRANSTVGRGTGPSKP